MKRSWLVGASLLCALLLAGALYLRLGDVGAGLRIAILIASVALAATMVWLVGRSSGTEG